MRNFIKKIIFIILLSSISATGFAAEHHDKAKILSHADCITQEYYSYKLDDKTTINDSLLWFKEHEGSIKYSLYYDSMNDIVIVISTCVNIQTKAKVEITMFYSIIDGECVVSNNGSHFIFSYYFDGKGEELHGNEARIFLIKFMRDEEEEEN